MAAATTGAAVGAGAGAVIGGPLGAVVGGFLGGSVGGMFGSSRNKRNRNVTRTFNQGFYNANQRHAQDPEGFGGTGPAGLRRDFNNSPLRNAMQFDDNMARSARGVGFLQPYQQVTPGVQGFLANQQNPNVAGVVTQAQQSGGLDREGLAKSLYASSFNPQQRALQQQQQIDDRQLLAQQSQAGLASSGAGIGQRQELGRQYADRLSGIAADAANNATAQSFQLDQNERIRNAELRQEQMLEQAGFDQNRQIQNASNLLNGNIAESEAYLAALGIDAETAMAARSEFLEYMGLRQEEYARLDEATKERLALMVDSYVRNTANMASVVNENDAELVKGTGFNVGGGASGGADFKK